jgi:tetratricopeptide (TPR) repeat protein
METQTVTLARALAIAVGHHQAGRLAEAEGIYRQVLARNPKQADAMQLLGTLLGQRGDLRDAQELMRQSLAIQPESAGVYFNLGEICRRLGRPGEALATILEGMRYRPGAVAYDNLAAALRDLKCDDAAIDALRTAIKFDPQYLEAIVKLGVVLSENGRAAEAVEAFERAAAIRPGWDESGRQVEMARMRAGSLPRERLSMADVTDARACIAICAAFTHLHRYEDAIAAAKRTIELAPQVCDPHVNLGWLYRMVGRLDDAEAACERAVSLDPQDAPARLNLGIIRLLRGDFSRGWPLYEFRKQCRGFKFARYSEPSWDGRPLDGKRILLWSEQGLGDSIQFLRYLPKVADLGGKIILAVQPELRRLVAGCVEVEQLADPAAAAPAFDVQCSLLSLPLALETTLETIPGGMPYLKAPEDLVGKWKERMEPYSGQMRVGLSWAGRPGHINDANRSMQLKDLGPLAATGAVFFSLQKWKTGFSIEGPDPAMRIIDWTDELADTADTAGLIANLDLVISVDSAVAHLAGAMGARVWVLLPKAADWRWLMDREDSPWYPTMKLFRQEKLGDWTGVVGRVAREISATSNSVQG